MRNLRLIAIEIIYYYYCIVFELDNFYYLSCMFSRYGGTGKRISAM